ncbi:MAG: type II toxin-antitoxin system VapC family toxin [Janthinobacterium lividum]
MILIDSNVLVAGLVRDHEHHAEAALLFSADPLPQIIVAAHSHAEAFVTLTRRGGGMPHAYDPARVIVGLAEIRSITTLVAMTAEQTIDAIERFADIGVGARLYDYLIGRTAVLHGAKAIVTFNTGHMRALFPGVAVATPGEWLALNPALSPPP